MPKIANIPATVEAKTGYGYAAIVDNEVVAFHSFEIGSALELADVDAKAAFARLSIREEVKAAKCADEAAWAAYEDSGYDDDAVNYEAACLEIRFGMASGGKFTHTFSKKEAKRVGLPRNWQ